MKASELKRGASGMSKVVVDVAVGFRCQILEVLLHHLLCTTRPDAVSLYAMHQKWRDPSFGQPSTVGDFHSIQHNRLSSS